MLFSNIFVHNQLLAKDLVLSDALKYSTKNNFELKLVSIS